jgi:proteic killer suppression protein
MKPKIQFSRQARKAFNKVPDIIQTKLMTWVMTVELEGLVYVQTIKGFHDEPLKGKRAGQRSIRLSRQWRAIYQIVNKEPVLITILEVTPHDYRTR